MLYFVSIIMRLCLAFVLCKVCENLFLELYLLYDEYLGTTKLNEQRLSYDVTAHFYF